MTRPVIALILLVAFACVSFGLRMAWLKKTMGTTGFRGFSSGSGLERLAGVLFGTGILLIVAASVVQIAGALAPLYTAWPVWVDVVAGVLAVAGVAGTSWAQAAMGASWRIGVDHAERTELVRRGPFRWVRNPVFAFLLLAGTGYALFLFDVLCIAGLACVWVAVELQVRVVEEPYLRRTHGGRYDEYCRRVGRFFPGVGMIRLSDGR